MHNDDHNDHNHSGGRGLFARHWSVAEPVPWHDVHWTDRAAGDGPPPMVTGPMKILVVDRKGTFSHDIERAARQQSPEPKVILVDHPTQVVEQVVAEAPDVVLVSPEEMTTTGLRRLAQVHRVAPRCV
ncbi:MAG TPA: hypothetical protein VFW71_05160, partial [Actinomycetota bacterium]|nr:hypothetical protein [Actinomycetota bacterium]